MNLDWKPPLVAFLFPYAFKVNMIAASGLWKTGFKFAWMTATATWRAASSTGRWHSPRAESQSRGERRCCGQEVQHPHHRAHGTGKYWQMELGVRRPCEAPLRGRLGPAAFITTSKEVLFASHRVMHHPVVEVAASGLYNYAARQNVFPTPITLKTILIPCNNDIKP